MKRILIVVALLVLSVAASPRSEADRSAAAMTGMEAHFTHSFTPKGFRTPQVESGSVIFGTLPRMRWTYTQPEQKTFVFDGSRSWFYVPADRQVTIADITEDRRRELPFLVVGDPAARERFFSVRENDGGPAITTTLQPRDSSSPVRNVTVVSDVSTHLIESIEYSDRDGNRTLFSFSGYHPARLSSDTFTFVAPPGVQTVRGD